MGKSKEESQWHLLDFFHDDDNACALTVFAHQSRYHVIVDPPNLGDSKSPVRKEYISLLKATRGDESDTGDEKETVDSGIDVSTDGEALYAWILQPLLPKLTADTSSGKDQTVQDWYHCPTRFYNLVVSEDGSLAAQELESDDELKQRMENFLPSMGLPQNLTAKKHDTKIFSAEELLVIAESDQPIGTPYHPCRVRTRDADETFFLKLVDNNQPDPVKREIKILQRIQQLDLPDDIHIPQLEGFVSFASHLPFPDRTNTQQAKTKKKNQVIMGFLLTDIPSATPLTHYLDSSVPQHKRDRWAQQTERLKSTLHRNGIIWGDAKSDNLLVDEQERLWMIDFGGSYTEGWVDMEVAETKKGDEIGVGKIVGALKDPVGGTFDPEDEDEEEEEEEDEGEDEAERTSPATTSSDPPASSKRKRDSDSVGQSSSPSRRRRLSGTKDDERDRKYCHCNQPSSGKMIACDGDECQREWFHFECIGLDAAPQDGSKWYCDDCQKS